MKTAAGPGRFERQCIGKRVTCVVSRLGRSASTPRVAIRARQLGITVVGTQALRFARGLACPGGARSTITVSDSSEPCVLRHRRQRSGRGAPRRRTLTGALPMPPRSFASVARETRCPPSSPHTEPTDGPDPNRAHLGHVRDNLGLPGIHEISRVFERGMVQLRLWHAS